VRNQADLVRAGVGETLQAQQEVKEDITGLARTAAIFEACTADIRTAFEANQGHLESQGEAVRAIRMEVDQLGPLGQAQARQLDQMQQEFALAAQEQVTGLERLDAGIQGVTSEVREQARLVQGMQDGQEQTSRQVKQVVESTEFLKVELGTIQRLTHALSERVEHVFKALGDLASRLADNLFGRRAPEPEPEPVTDDEPAGVP
jgi:chromosome segregation ATPase